MCVYECVCVCTSVYVCVCVYVCMCVLCVHYALTWHAVGLVGGINNHVGHVVGDDSHE